MKSSAKKIELASVDDLFSTEEGRQDAKLEKIQEIPLSELHPFKNHPFKVKDDEAMMETADSIKQYGVLVPAIARPDPEGGYELVAGHRRHRASELAEKETMPEEIAFRKKLGFIVPIRIWMADERYNQDVQRLFHSDIAEKFFDVDAINAIFDEYVGGNSDNWRKVWTIYTFLVWYEEYFVKR